MKRELPLCKASDDLYIGAFVMFGDVELTVHCAAELLKRAPEYDSSHRTGSQGNPLCCMKWPARAARIRTIPTNQVERLHN
ncbi:MAG: adenine phosphoribosyltransferase, partial [Oscillospiraceae bacterium]